jgi:trimeric autotransporter adhesin
LTSDAKPQLTLEHQTNGDAKMLFKNNGNAAWQLAGKTNGNGGDFTLDFVGASANQSARIMTAREDGTISFGTAGNAGSRARFYHGNRGLILLSPDTLKTWEFWVNSTNGTMALFNNTLGTAIPAGTFATNGVYTPSDRRLKKDIAGLSNNVLSKVLQLNPVSYRYTAESAAAQKSLGFLAQEVAVLFPELVAENAGRDGKDLHLSLNYAGFGVVAIKAVQEQQKEIEQLKQENETLRKKMEEIEKLLRELKRN